MVLRGAGPYVVPPPALTPLFATPGLSFCQLQKQQILLSSYINSTAASYLPQCQDSGDYSPVQCDLRREQCWCVAADGMEVYGTRQRGRPARCKCREHGAPGEAEVLGSLPLLTEAGWGLPEERQGAWPSARGEGRRFRRVPSLLDVPRGGPQYSQADG